MFPKIMETTGLSLEVMGTTGLSPEIWETIGLSIILSSFVGGLASDMGVNPTVFSEFRGHHGGPNWGRNYKEPGVAENSEQKVLLV